METAGKCASGTERYWLGIPRIQTLDNSAEASIPARLARRERRSSASTRGIALVPKRETLLPAKNRIDTDSAQFVARSRHCWTPKARSDRMPKMCKKVMPPCHQTDVLQCVLTKPTRSSASVHTNSRTQALDAVAEALAVRLVWLHSSLLCVPTIPTARIVARCLCAL